VAPLSHSKPPATSAKGWQPENDLRLFVDGDTTRNLRPLFGRYRREFSVTEDYFRMLGLRIQRGRGFASDDVAGSRVVAVVSQRFAETVWPGANALGRELQFGAIGTRIQIVGVVDNVRDIQGGRDGISAESRSDVYFSLRQVPAFSPALLARALTGLSGLQVAGQRIAREVDPRVIVRAGTMADGVERHQMVTRVFGALIGGFAACGLVLSIIGIYGVVAYGINQRTRELGIRMALGGTSRDVLRLIMSGALRFVLVGLAIGLGLALATTQLLRVALLGVSPTDPMTYLISCVLFGAVALLACYLPARRVTRIDPLVALRSE
jgi:ABC-type antimicrobial peptide transport system permease subunit